MIGRITLYIPFPCNFSGLTWYRKRQAGFSFTNHATLILSQNIGVDISELPEWAKKNQTLYFAEMLFAAYLAWSQENYKKPIFTKQKISEGFTKLSEYDQKSIIKAWNESLTMGAKQIPVKKKL